MKESLAKLQEYAKDCEKAINKTRKDAKKAEIDADRIINSLKGQPRRAEERCDNTARELQVWKERYGDVEFPAAQLDALQTILLEWQIKADKAHSEISGLEREPRGEETRTRVKLEDKHQSSNTSPEEGNQVAVKTERTSNSGTCEAGHTALAEAEAKAALYKTERDALHRMLQEEVARNAKMAESLVLRNAKLAESLVGGLGR